MPAENQRPVSGNPNEESEDDDSNRWDHYTQGSPQKWRCLAVQLLFADTIQVARVANIRASGTSISELATATTTTMTTTVGSSKVWLATTSEAAMFRCDVPRPSTTLVSFA